MSLLDKIKAVAAKGKEIANKEYSAYRERQKEEGIKEANLKAIEKAAYNKALAEERVKQAEAKGKAAGLKRAKQGTAGQRVFNAIKNIHQPDLWGNVNLGISKKKKKRK